MGKESRMLLEQNVHDRCTDRKYSRSLEAIPETPTMEYVGVEGVNQRRTIKFRRWRTAVLVERVSLGWKSKVVQA